MLSPPAKPQDTHVPQAVIEQAEAAVASNNVKYNSKTQRHALTCGQGTILDVALQR